MPRRVRTTGPARPASSAVPSSCWNSDRLHCSPPPSAPDGPLPPSDAPAGPRRAFAGSSSRVLLYPAPSLAWCQRVLTHILILTRMAYHPVENSMFHGTRRFSRGSLRSAKRAEAHATRPHLFRQHRTQHRPRPASIRPERIHCAVRRTHPSERTPLLSPSPGKAQSTLLYQRLTRIYIAPKPSIMKNKG